nr:hypothetical protein [uncultured Desulfobacter sp.]
MKKFHKELWFMVMVAMVLGVIFGMILSPFGFGLLSDSQFKPH